MPKIDRRVDPLSDVVLVGDEQGGEVDARDRADMPPGMELGVPLEDRVGADTVDKLAQVQVDQPDGYSESVHAQGAADEPEGRVVTLAPHGGLAAVQRCGVEDDCKLEDAEGGLEGVELDLPARDGDKDGCQGWFFVLFLFFREKKRSTM